MVGRSTVTGQAGHGGGSSSGPARPPKAKARPRGSGSRAPDPGGLTIISYDIHSAKIRRRVARWLEGVAVRVQKSVFESARSPAELAPVRRRIAAAIGKQDSVRWYRLCAGCTPRIEIDGLPYRPWQEAVLKV
jgi:CRISPR-associated protein Cas2